MSLQSPWLAELVRARPLKRLTEYLETDVVIIGGGIAGAATAAFALLETKERIVLVEAGKVGHGATGRNAGQMLTELERPIADLISDFGYEVVKTGLQKIETAWELVAQLQAEFDLKTPIIHAPGYEGFSSLEPFLEALENLFWKREMGLPWTVMRVASLQAAEYVLPERYDGLWVEDTHASILADLETEDTSYFALFQIRVACTNSAQLAEELLQALLNRFGNRFALYEETPITELHLERDAIRLKSGPVQIKVKQVVLCTNGFERFRIFHHQNIDVNDQVHRDVRGLVSYMQGYFVPGAEPVKALSYYDASQISPDDDDPSAAETFLYLTRRSFQTKKGHSGNLVCVGGPETAFSEEMIYNGEQAIPEAIQTEFTELMHGSPLGAHASVNRPAFEWHGLMGYTNGRVRCVGREPCYANLLYNLGCNGIGIMTSVYGGRRTAGLLKGEDDGASLFDPKMHTCVLAKDRADE